MVRRIDDSGKSHIPSNKPVELNQKMFRGAEASTGLFLAAVGSLKQYAAALGRPSSLKGRVSARLPKGPKGGEIPRMVNIARKTIQ